jgi:hypothetical protein
VAIGIVGALAFAAYDVARDLYDIIADMNDPKLAYDFVLSHPLVNALRLPCSTFAHVMAADGTTAEWFMWTGVSVAIIAALYLLIIVLDADYMEVAIARSARQYAALERFKRGQFISERTAKRKRRWSLPSLPHLGGFGTIAWRQLTGLAHAWNRRIMELFVLCIVGGLILRRYEIDENMRNSALPATLGVFAYLTVLASNFVRYDFRSDLDVMDGLKTLPISARRIAAAQLVAPTFLFASAYAALGLGMAIGVGKPGILFAAILLGAPFSALFIATENLTFLFWPVRMAYQTNMDVQHMGRAFFGLMVKFLILIPAYAIAAGLAFLSWYLLDSPALGYGTAAIVMWMETALVVPAIAAAFEKFDPSTDTPP